MSPLRLALISSAFCVMALLQVLGVGSIGSFMSVAAEPESIESSRYLHQLINGMLFPAMEAFAKGLSAVAIMAFLLAAAYGLIYGVLRPHIGRLGEKLRSSNRLRFKAAGEAFGAIKDVKILGKEPAFEAAYGHAAERFAQTQASNMIVSRLPKHILEAVAFGLIVVLEGVARPAAS